MNIVYRTQLTFDIGGERRTCVRDREHAMSGISFDQRMYEWEEDARMLKRIAMQAARLSMPSLVAVEYLRVDGNNIETRPIPYGLMQQIVKVFGNGS